MADKAAKPAEGADGKPAKHQADDIFDKYDKDKSGSLDKKEVEAAVADYSKAKGKKKPNGLVVMAAFKLMDKDGSGTIDREEFRSLCDKLMDGGKKAGDKAKAEADKKKAKK